MFWKCDKFPKICSLKIRFKAEKGQTVKFITFLHILLASVALLSQKVQLHTKYIKKGYLTHYRLLEFLYQRK